MTDRRQQKEHQHATFRWRRILLAWILCYLYGRLVCLIPSPDDPGTFWIANLAAPFVACAILAGSLVPRLTAAMGAGSVASMLMVAGFYRFESVGFGSEPNQYDLPPDTSALDLWFHGQRMWFNTFLLGDLPWLLIALVTGLVFGVVGFLLRGHRRWLATMVGAIFIAESVWHFLGLSILGDYPLTLINASSWSVGIILGLVVAGLSLRTSPALVLQTSDS